MLICADLYVLPMTASATKAKEGNRSIIIASVKTLEPRKVFKQIGKKKMRRTKARKPFCIPCANQIWKIGILGPVPQPFLKKKLLPTQPFKV